MKRIFDFLLSLFSLLLLAPVLGVAMLLVFLQDFKSPLYVAKRVGRGQKRFSMFKIRSMVTDADKTGVDSTSANDQRVTLVGRYIRKFKIDELSQLFNVLLGSMSFVGPRPNVEREVNIYTDEEKRLLSVKPGITDISSIVFSDLGEILKNSRDPNIDYNQLVRPWKSRLGLFYIDHRSFLLDLKLIFLTAISIFSREQALNGIVRILRSLGAGDELVLVAGRKRPLEKAPPPGATDIVTSRDI